MSNKNELKRGLNNRQLQLMAIGGTIGTSLFLGSAKTISTSGPSIILAYALAGFVIFLAMRLLGEMILSNLKFISFRELASEYLGPWAGFFVGWMYWMFWIVTGMQDAVAVSVYVKAYLPELPAFIPGLLVIAFIFILNSLTVKLFGELEFWLSIIKIVAIVALIVAGFYLIISHSTYSFEFVDGQKHLSAQISNLWIHGGFFPLGFGSFLLGFQLAFIAYGGVENFGTAVGETKDPETVLPKAINAIPVRISIFYIGAIFVILCLVPWDAIKGLTGSPFVNVFQTLGFASAGIVMTFVLITAAVSGANSGLYSTSRMLYSLANENHAPSLFNKTSKRFVPQNALNFSALVILVPVFAVSFLNEPMDAFIIFASWATGAYLIMWIILSYCYLQYRKNFSKLHNESIFKAPAGKLSATFTLFFFAFIFIMMLFDSIPRIGFILAVVTFFIMFIIFKKTQTENKN